MTCRSSRHRTRAAGAPAECRPGGRPVRCSQCQTLVPRPPAGDGFSPADLAGAPPPNVPNTRKKRRGRLAWAREAIESFIAEAIEKVAHEPLREALQVLAIASLQRKA